MKEKTSKNKNIIDASVAMVERLPSYTSSTKSTNRPQLSSRIYLGDSPPTDVERCRQQLLTENVLLPEKIDPEMIGKPDVYFDGQNEECFVLDTFNSLILSTRQAKKDFLLARVMTVDPNDPTRTYWSYYSAHQINKVLFRTQSDKILLHRMHSRKPLNNMLIVGAVHYFRISMEEVDRARSIYEKETGEKVSDLIMARHSSVTSLLDVSRRTYPLPVLTKSLSDVDLSESVPEGVQPFIQPNVHSAATAAATTTTTKRKSATLEYRAKFIGSDEDFLQRQNFRKTFEENTVNPGDAELFPLIGPGQPTMRVLTAHDGQTVAVRGSGPRQTPTCANLFGLVVWPPRDSILLSNTGVLNEWSFAIAALVIIGLTVGLGMAVFPVWLMLITGPVCALILATLAFTLVHFRE